MTAAIILAAGDSRRMGTAKALLPFRNSTFINHILLNLQRAGCQPIVTVLGKSSEQILKNSRVACFQYVLNPSPQDGMLSSIKIAIKALPHNTKGFLLTLTDHPFVTQNTYKEILEIAGKQSGQIIIPEFKGRRGHPVYFDRIFFQNLLDTPLEQSARDVIQKNKTSVYYLPVEDKGILKDIDTPQELKKYGLR